MLIYIPIHGEVTAYHADAVSRISPEYIKPGNVFVIHLNSEGGQAAYYMPFLELSRKIKVAGATLITIGERQISSLAFYIFLLGERRYLIDPEVLMLHDIQIDAHITDPLQREQLKEKYAKTQALVDTMGECALGKDYWAIPRNKRLSIWDFQDISMIGQVVDCAWSEIQDESFDGTQLTIR